MYRPVHCPVVGCAEAVGAEQIIADGKADPAGGKKQQPHAESADRGSTGRRGHKHHQRDIQQGGELKISRVGLFHPLIKPGRPDAQNKNRQRQRQQTALAEERADIHQMPKGEHRRAKGEKGIVPLRLDKAHGQQRITHKARTEAGEHINAEAFIRTEKEASHTQGQKAQPGQTFEQKGPPVVLPPTGPEKESS